MQQLTSHKDNSKDLKAEMRSLFMLLSNRLAEAHPNLSSSQMTEIVVATLGYAGHYVSETYRTSAKTKKRRSNENQLSFSIAAAPLNQKDGAAIPPNSSIARRIRKYFSVKEIEQTIVRMVRLQRIHGRTVLYYLGSQLEQDLASNLAGDITQRKQTGAYYTPPVIVGELIRSALAPLVKGLNSDQLLQLKILDPSVGSGNFLLGALHYLEDHILKISKTPPSRLREKIAQNCLFGIDINKSAVSSTIDLLAAASGCEPGHLTNNFVVGDGLNIKNALSRLSRNAAVSEGFDAVVGNPPYVDYRQITKSTLELCKGFQSCSSKDKFSLYIPFVEAAFRFSRTGGMVAFIIPNQWLSASYGRSLRSYLVEQKSICSLVDVGSIKVFDEAATYPVLLVAENRKSHGPYNFQVAKIADLADLNDSKVFSTISTSTLNSKSEFRIRISSESNLDKAWLKVSKLKRLAEFAEDFRWGTSASGYGKKKIGTSDFSELSASQKTSYVKMIQTADIKPSRIEWQKEFLPKELFTPDQLKRFAKPKLVIARLTRRIQASVDRQGYALGKASFLIPKDEAHLEALCVILSSSFASVWFKTNFESVHMNGGYLRFDIPYLKDLPIPNLQPDQIRTLKALHNKMSVSFNQTEIDAAVGKIYGFSLRELSDMRKSLDLMAPIKKVLSRKAA